MPKPATAMLLIYFSIILLFDLSRLLKFDKIITMTKKIFIIYSLIIISGGLFLTNIFISKAANSISNEIEDIQNQIKIKENEITKLGEEQKIYEQKIEQIRKEAKTLKNEISFLDNQIAKIQLEIKKQEKEIEYLELSIKNIQFRILEKEKQIESQKEQIKRIIQLIDKEDKKDYLSLFALNSSLSSLVDRIYYLRTLEKNLLHSLNQYEIIKSALEEQKLAKREKVNQIESAKIEIETQKAKLASNKQVQSYLLDQSRGAEWKFQSLLANAIEEERAREKEIQELERTVKEKLASLEKEKESNDMEEGNEIVFSWPVPKERITCLFHDSDYPYRYLLGEHSGIDIRAAQGTTVRAAASGYVAQAKYGGMGYSYIMIVHNETFSTLYGHLSQISVVQNEYIKRGEVIGKSGGMPGTPGAGNFSTGPHLHFEVRMDGLPVNPLDYLL